MELHQGFIWPFAVTGLTLEGEGKEGTTKTHLFASKPVQHQHLFCGDIRKDGITQLNLGMFLGGGYAWKRQDPLGMQLRCAELKSLQSDRGHIKTPGRVYPHLRPRGCSGRWGRPSSPSQMCRALPCSQVLP